MSELEHFEFFKFLEPGEKKRLEEISIKKECQKDEILFFKGDESKYLHFLISGRVKLYTHDHKENEIVIHNLNAPTLIAEAACFEELRLPANCACEDDSKLILIDYERFKNEFLLKPQIALFFIQSLSNKIKSLQRFINYNVSLSMMERITKFLYENEEMLVNLKQAKIAQILNITPETLSRKVATLKQEQVIQNEKGYIKILDHDKLKSFIAS